MEHGSHGKATCISAEEDSGARAGVLRLEIKV